MRSVVVFSWVVVVGCAGVGPLPHEIAASLPPPVELDAGGRQRVEARRAAAWQYLAAGDYAAARAAAQDALALDPRDAAARAVRARCEMVEAQRESPPELRAWRRAEGDLLLARRLDPDDPEIGLLHAGFLEADGHLLAAADVAEEIVAAHPRHPGALRQASRLRYELGEERAALAHLDRLLVLAPDDRESRYRTAQCRLRVALTALREETPAAAQADHLAAVIAAFAEYRERFPEDGEGWSGEAFARLRRYEVRGLKDPAELRTIERLYGEASARAPSSPDPDYNLGLLRERLGDNAGARAAYEAALRRDPEHLPSLLNLAATLVAAGERAAAVDYCQRALRLNLTAPERRALQRFVSPGSTPATAAPAAGVSGDTSRLPPPPGDPRAPR